MPIDRRDLEDDELDTMYFTMSDDCVDFISSNIDNVGGAMTSEDLFDFLNTWFDNYDS